MTPHSCAIDSQSQKPRNLWNFLWNALIWRSGNQWVNGRFVLNKCKTEIKGSEEITLESGELVETDAPTDGCADVDPNCADYEKNNHCSFETIQLLCPTSCGVGPCGISPSSQADVDLEGSGKFKFLRQNSSFLRIVYEFMIERTFRKKFENYSELWYFKKRLFNTLRGGRSLGRLSTFRALQNPNFTNRIPRTKTAMPIKKILTTYEAFRLPFKFFWSEKKVISLWPFCEFCPKIEFQRFWKFKITQKIPETCMLCWIGRFLLTIYRHTETTRRTARKFLTKVLEPISNLRLVRTVLEGKNEKSSKRRSATLNRIQHRHAMC